MLGNFFNRVNIIDRCFISIDWIRVEFFQLNQSLQYITIFLDSAWVVIKQWNEKI